MKKFMSILVALTLLFSLGACGNNTNSEESSSTTPQNSKVNSTSIEESNNQNSVSESVAPNPEPTESGAKSLVVYFSWSGNTQNVAEVIQSQTDSDIFEINPKTAYSDDYNTVLDLAQEEQRTNARPAMSSNIENIEQYDVIYVGYPNWWASIPMPIASFLEEYDFSGKTIIPFCSHGGGRFGQSLTAIAKLAPDAAMGEALSIHYSGSSELSSDVTDWLSSNGIQ